MRMCSWLSWLPVASWSFENHGLGSSDPPAPPARSHVEMASPHPLNQSFSLFVGASFGFSIREKLKEPQPSVVPDPYKLRNSSKVVHLSLHNLCIPIITWRQDLRTVCSNSHRICNLKSTRVHLKSTKLTSFWTHYCPSTNSSCCHFKRS